MAINFDGLEIGWEYERPFLAKLWGYKTFHPLSRGVFTPANSKVVILFVTRDKQQALTQYTDYIDENLLFWEGEEKHGSDKRIIRASQNGDEIYLFFRETHHSPFIFYGPVYLFEYQENKQKPSEFIFRVGSLYSQPSVFDDVREHSAEYNVLDKTEQDSIIKSRIGQGNFRENLIKIWGGCSVTGTKNLSLVTASHIKPWRVSTNSERLNKYNGLLLIPNLDTLFDKGFISFESNGKLIISNNLSGEDQVTFRLSTNVKLRHVFDENKPFLEFHCENILKP